jgi:hypothetical protein
MIIKMLKNQTTEVRKGDICEAMYYDCDKQTVNKVLDKKDGKYKFIKYPFNVYSSEYKKV